MNLELTGLTALYSGASLRNFAALIMAELAKWPKFVAAAKIKSE